MTPKATKKGQRKKATAHARTIELPCVSFTQGDRTLAVCAANAKLLWRLVQINKREPDKDVGYQRVLSQVRVNAISKYVDTANSIPTSVLISFEAEYASLSVDGRTLRVQNRPDAGWVIDGQHRLAGAERAKLDITLPVVAFIGLALEEQIQQFVTINREAKGVPTSLYLDLLKFLPPGKSDTEKAKERAADIANELRRDEESPFFGRIVVVTSPQRGELSLTNFVRKVAPLIQMNRGRLATHLEHEQRQIISNYYKAIENVFPGFYRPRDSIFFQTIGFGALLNALPTVLDYSIKYYQGFRVGDAAQVLKRIEDFDFAQWRELGSGNAAELAAAEEFRVTLMARIASESGDDGGSLALD